MPSSGRSGRRKIRYFGSKPWPQYILKIMTTRFAPLCEQSIKGPEHRSLVEDLRTLKSDAEAARLDLRMPVDESSKM